MKISIMSAGQFVPLLTRRLWSRQRLPCNCLVIENATGLHIVDTGLHQRMVEVGLGAQIYTQFMGLEITKKNSLRAELTTKGLNAKDVSTITLTHLHPDHTAGLIDFPEAEVFLSGQEWDYVQNLNSNDFYKKHFDPRHWHHVKKWNLVREFNLDWMGFAAASLTQFGQEAYLVSLPGHTGGGHCGVAISVGKRWVFHVGDAYFLRDDLNDKLAERHLMSEMVQAAISPNSLIRHATARKIALLKENTKDKIEFISSHEEQDSDQVFTE